DPAAKTCFILAGARSVVPFHQLKRRFGRARQRSDTVVQRVPGRQGPVDLHRKRLKLDMESGERVRQRIEPGGAVAGFYDERLGDDAALFNGLSEIAQACTGGLD